MWWDYAQSVPAADRKFSEHRSLTLPDYDTERSLHQSARCFLHRESLVMKKMSVEPSSVLSDVVDQHPGPSSSSYHRQVAF